MTTVLSVSTTNPTPPRPSELNANSYRLLYRGALSLPDSHLLLDGLTFNARLDTPSKSNHLLRNPLALALESMRGRPSLRSMGVVKLIDSDMWLDESGGIELDIHPRATLTRIYFENIFCLMPLASTSYSISSEPSAPLDVGVKVALGDTDGPDTTHVVIFARPLHYANEIHNNQQTLNLIVARLMAYPPPSLRPPLVRLPRPDDPIPRKPPVMLFGAGKRELKRVGSAGMGLPGKVLKRAVISSNTGPNVKRKKTSNESSNLPVDLGRAARLREKKDDVLFKVPEVPPLLVRSNGNGKATQADDEDVFGGVDMAHVRQGIVGKRKVDEDGMVPGEEVVEMERANKNIIKRCTLDHLYKIKDPTTAKMSKSQPEFKELFGWIYRGVGYALRAQMKVQPVSQKRVERLVQIHIDMYVGGHAGNITEMLEHDPPTPMAAV